MPVFIDQLGRSIQLRQKPQRIISLVPSITETLYSLGLDQEIAGITKFCIRPDHWFSSKKRIGGTKDPDIEAIREIQPDLIIANKEENSRAILEALEIDYPIWISDIRTLEDAYGMIEALGELLERQEKAGSLIGEIEEQFSTISAYSLKKGSPSMRRDRIDKNLGGPGRPMRLREAVYLIWRNPYMAAGGDSFIGEMMLHCGFTNLLERGSRYPEISIEQLSDLHCPWILLSSEPYPFKQKHLDELQSKLPQSKILLVDGEMFSWYGSRLLYAPAYFRDLLSGIQE
jgi:ABC-type Fe3+-hydroxamate transport system substrate-binding protein